MANELTHHAPQLENLVPAGGDIYCHIFENSLAGIQRGIWWSVTVAFMPVIYCNSACECSMTCEWIPWPLRNWHDLDGHELETYYGEHGIESSFYLCDHMVGTRTSLAIALKEANVFSIRMKMEVESNKCNAECGKTNARVVAATDVAFTGLLVVPENLDPAPVTVDQAKEVASRFVDLGVYQEPTWEGHTYRFAPLIIDPCATK